MNPVGLNVRCSRYDLAYTRSSRAHFFFFGADKKKEERGYQRHCKYTDKSLGAKL